jgi:hypothetical protein
VLNAPGRAPTAPKRARAQLPHHATDGDELLEVGAEGLVLQRVHNVFARQRERDVRLLEVVADGNLPAERVAAALDAQGIEIVRVALNEYRHAQAGLLERVGHTLLVPEIGEADQDAVDLVPMGREEIGALARVGIGFDPTELRLLGREHDGADAEGFKEFVEIFAGLADEDVGKKSRLPMMTPSVVGRACACAASCGVFADMICSAARKKREPPVREGDPHARIVLRSSAGKLSVSLRKTFAK